MLVAALDPRLPTPTRAGENPYLDNCWLIRAVAWDAYFENVEKLWASGEAPVGKQLTS